MAAASAKDIQDLSKSIHQLIKTVGTGSTSKSKTKDTSAPAAAKTPQYSEKQILAGFAGSTADAFTLIERFEEKLNAFGGNMKRAAIELAKDWRTDRFLRKLEAMLIVANEAEILIISGTGDVIEPDNQIASIGSGSMYAQSAAIALKKHADNLTAEQMVQESLNIAADICIYTNHNIIIETL